MSRIACANAGSNLVNRGFGVQRGRPGWLAADAKLAARGSGFRGITLAHNVRRKEDVAAIIALAKKLVVKSLNLPRMFSGAVIAATFRMSMVTCGK